MNTSPDSTPVVSTPHAAILTGTDAAPTHGTLVATGDGATAGLVSYWRCDGDVNLEELTALWADAGGDPEHLPPAPSPAAALAHAVRTLGLEYHLLARPMSVAGGGSKRRRGGGWALVREIARVLPAVPRVSPVEAPAEESAAVPAIDLGVGDGPFIDLGAETMPAPETPAEVELDPLSYETVLVVRILDGVLHVTRADPVLEGKLRAAFEYHTGHLTPTEMATWLPALVHAFDGIGIRDNGGVYFIPASGRANWQRVVSALRAVSSHRVFGIPVMPAEDTALAFLDALEREAEAFVEAAMLALPTLGDRGRDRRMADAAALHAKLERYETLFGEGRLQTVRARIKGLDRTGTVAALLAGTPAA